MADEVDRANDMTDEILKHALAKTPKFDSPSLTHCIDCDAEIPLERQKLGNVKRCFDCQNEKDKYEALKTLGKTLTRTQRQSKHLNH